MIDTTLPLQARFAQAMDALEPPGRLGLAVSGGGDSMALMALAQRWGKAHLCVATVDHGLRPEAAQEAEMVAQAAHDLGLAHVTLQWRGWDGQGNLQDRARTARRFLLREWAQAEGLSAVLTGHTRDDQAETVLMRLARGSGVDGLAGMAARYCEAGLLWLRPLLDMSRAELRAWLQAQGGRWCDDPGNDDLRFDRIKARQALVALAPLGLSADRLVQTAQRMRDASCVLEQSASQSACRIARYAQGDIIFDAPAFDALPADTRHRLAASALCQIASRPYRPRLARLRAALASSCVTLHGCLVTRNATELRITREAQAVRATVAQCGGIWDGRWQIIPPPDHSAAAALEIRALGQAGLAQCPDRSLWKLPRRSLLASPAVWLHDQLVAAPLAGMGTDWQMRPFTLRGVLAQVLHSH